ncbi:MAG: hypothetical protein Q9166_004011 [cf. Caloplaca sp. 2 TL-2023]
MREGIVNEYEIEVAILRSTNLTAVTEHTTCPPHGPSPPTLTSPLPNWTAQQDIANADIEESQMQAGSHGGVEMIGETEESGQKETGDATLERR